MITYCTNIHPGETWDEAFSELRAHVPAVRAGLAGPDPFPISLWLSARAAREFDGEALARFDDWRHEQQVTVASINGFPYGGFHGRRVKENVYLPDWRSPERLAHTRRLAELLAGWLPDAAEAVISTVPVGFRSAGTDWSGALANLREALAHFDDLSQRTGRDLILALEPEPGCLLQSAGDVLRLMDDLRLPPSLRCHLGVCYDCCHHAVMFEDVRGSIGQLAGAGIRIAQWHVSSALRVRGDALDSLRGFREPTYLHQTAGRTRTGQLLFYPDLDEAFAEAGARRDVEEWRTHFHVPVFTDRVGDCGTTQPELIEALESAPADAALVVETYSFGALPRELRLDSVVENVVRELRWTRELVSRLATGDSA